MSVKDNVRMDDLFYVTSNYYPTTDSKVQRQYASCSLCGEFANIHCRNCTESEIWLCVDHWKDHRLNNISAGNKADNFYPNPGALSAMLPTHSLSLST
jgi:hypothetical protein